MRRLVVQKSRQAVALREGGKSAGQIGVLAADRYVCAEVHELAVRPKPKATVGVLRAEFADDRTPS